MERTISVEEKIRRAEEIYERRKQGNSRPIATVNVNNEKKDVKLLKKMIIQILICVSIYLVIYVVQNNQYVFSKDFTNQVNDILSYDTNFNEIYNFLKCKIESIIPKSTENEQQPDSEAIGGAEENIDNSNESQQEDNQENEQKSEQENNTTLSQTEQDIINIKNTTTFIKPIEGTITSRFGQRETATGRVPKNHTGTDIAANLGTKIKAATDGEVVLASEEGDYGKHLKIQIGEVSIIYAHCNNLYVKQADKVVQGQEIAEVGSTGNSTRSTLTFRNKNLRKDNRPTKYFRIVKEKKYAI
jgi:murein DD-endopeptidase MepM/ murein hydrolase activator NlpD